jgi:hypothetical protein
MLFAGLIQNWKLIGLVALVATVLIYRTVLVHERDSARAQAATLRDASAVLRADNALMASAVARQNEAIGALQNKMKLAQQAAVQREAQYAAGAEQAMSEDLAHANAVRRGPVPGGCQGAINWGNAQGPELGRW